MCQPFISGLPPLANLRHVTKQQHIYDVMTGKMNALTHTNAAACWAINRWLKCVSLLLISPTEPDFHHISIYKYSIYTVGQVEGSSALTEALITMHKEIFLLKWDVTDTLCCNGKWKSVSDSPNATSRT